MVVLVFSSGLFTLNLSESKLIFFIIPPGMILILLNMFCAAVTSTFEICGLWSQLTSAALICSPPLSKLPTSVSKKKLSYVKYIINSCDVFVLLQPKWGRRHWLCLWSVRSFLMRYILPDCAVIPEISLVDFFLLHTHILLVRTHSKV